MKILVLGASQGTGARVVEAALARGHTVTAFARHPEKLHLHHSLLIRRVGDFHDARSVDEAVAGHDAVVVTASAGSRAAFRAHPTFFSDGTRLVLRAMQAHQVRRLVVLSALGVGESRPLANALVDALVIRWIVRIPYEDHERQEALVKASDREWVITRPGLLHNGRASGAYLKKTGLARAGWTLSRADLADFLVKACESDEWVRLAVQLGH